MRTGYSFIVLASLLGAGSACIIVTDDGDDTEGETGNVTTGNVTTGTDTGAATAADGETTAADTGAEGSTAAAETAGVPACGWGPTGDDSIPEGYVCGGEGEDPDGNYPMLCPEDIELVAGGACGTVGGQGCCDAQGNAWFCGDDGAGPVLVLIEC